jgi:nucleotide-binding universal stress UspA family protein
MIEKRILIPVDFSPASEVAIEFGKFLASKSRSIISLLHVYQDDDLSCEECEKKLQALADKINAEEGLQCEISIQKGSIFTEIPEVAANPDFGIMVIATHGRKGFRQKLFGADILKLLKKVPVPALVVQEDSKLPEGGFKKAIFPVGSHDDYEKKINAMINFAGIFDTEIHIYSIDKPGFDQTEKLRENILETEERFTQKGITFKRVDEDQNMFSVGYAKQTLKYAGAEKADLIAIMSVPTQENAYFADSDKEAIITNDLRIPVLCTSDAEQDL